MATGGHQITLSAIGCVPLRERKGLHLILFFVDSMCLFLLFGLVVCRLGFCVCFCFLVSLSYLNLDFSFCQPTLFVLNPLFQTIRVFLPCVAKERFVWCLKPVLKGEIIGPPLSLALRLIV